jgi:ankyrin repeat protein
LQYEKHNANAREETYPMSEIKYIQRLILVILLLLVSVNLSFAIDNYEKMMTAIDKNDVATVKKLLKKGINPNETRDTRASPTYLTDAAYQGSVAIVKLLISAGANVHGVNGAT